MASTGPSQGFLKKFLPKKKEEAADIELPNRSGKTDPRLKKKSKLGQIMEGASIFKNLGKK